MNAQATDATGDEDIAGYRVVRTLGLGSRAHVYLGHARSGGAPVAVKVFKRDVDGDSIAAEVAALEQAASLHVVRLLDVCAAGDGDTTLVMERADGGSLASLLRQRSHLRSGEAVTILVCVCRGVMSMHAAGFAHGALSAAHVHFDGAGRPLVISLGHAQFYSQLDRAAQNSAAGDDWGRFGSVAHAVLDRVEAEGHEKELARLRGAIDALSAIENKSVASGETDAQVRLEDAAFAFAQPAPVVLNATKRIPVRSGPPAPAATASVADLGVLSGEGNTPGSDAPIRKRHSARAPRRLAAFGGDWAARAEAVLERGAARSVKARIAPILRTRRKPLMVAIGVASVIGIVGVAAIPAHEQSEAGPSHDAVAVPPSTSSRAPSSTPLDTSSGMPQPASAGLTATAAGDDPVAATMALLALRQKCIRQRSLQCLAGVDQTDSPLAAADRSLIGDSRGQTRGGDRYATLTVSLVERTGDSALLELSPPRAADAAQAKPASALVIKGEAGWRLREVFDG